MLPRISRKQYAYMTDLAAMCVGDPGSAEKEVALVSYQEEIRWPWRATEEQVQDWHQLSAIWDAHVAAVRRD